MTIDLVIKGGICVSHRGIEEADIAIRDGIIVAIGSFSEINAEKTIDATGLHILPGIIDTEVHISTDEIETFETATTAAVKGGITSLFSISNDISLLKSQIEDPRVSKYCDYAFYISATANNLSKLGDLEQQDGCAGISIAMGEYNNHPVIADDKTLLKVMQNGKRRVVIHAEEQERLDERQDYKEEGNVFSHSVWRDEKTALNATLRIISIARGAGRTLHLKHISTENEMALIAANKDIATASVTPHHLLLNANKAYKHFGNYVQIDPPLRDEKNRIGLWKALSSGIVDMIASQHNPQSILKKDQNYPNSPSGCPSVQTMLPLMLDQVNRGSLSLITLMDLTSAGPARVFNIANKGRIAVGYDADFTLVDLKKKWELADEDVETACGWDINAGQQFVGQVKATIVRGQTAMWEGEIFSNAIGRSIRFHDTFKAYEKE